VFDVVKDFDADVTIDGESIGDVMYAFDLLELDGVDIRSWPYRERLAALMNLLFSVQQTTIKLVDTAFTSHQKLELLKELKAKKRDAVARTTGNADLAAVAQTTGAVGRFSFGRTRLRPVLQDRRRAAV